MKLLFNLFLFLPLLRGCYQPPQSFNCSSEFYDEDREIWLSLPDEYDTLKSYTVLYVLDADFKFKIVESKTRALEKEGTIPEHIIVGITNKSFDDRGKDLTFSHSQYDKDGSKITDKYDIDNSGNATNFLNFLNIDLIPRVDEMFKTNGENVLIGHSFGGYFASYILTKENKFTAFQIYDPSIWYSNGEVIDEINEHREYVKDYTIFISYQENPKFHNSKIKELVKEINQIENIRLESKAYPNENHGSIYEACYEDGIRSLYKL